MTPTDRMAAIDTDTSDEFGYDLVQMNMSHGMVRRRAGSVGVRERRAEPRFLIEAEARLNGRGRSVMGRVVDASVSGVLVELTEPLSFLDREVGLELSLDTGTVVRAEGEVVRRALSPEGRVLLAVRLVEDVAGRELVRRHGARPVRDYRRRQRPSRAKPRPPRPAHEVQAELRGLGSRVLELALVEPEGAPPEALMRWFDALRPASAGEAGHPRTNRLLLREIARLHGSAGSS
jgi:hypothetical protein